MKGNGKYLTIAEASKVFNLNITTIYKRVKKGQLTSIDGQINGKEVKKVSELDLIRLYGRPVERSQMTSNDGQIEHHLTSNNVIRNQMKEVIEEYFENKQTQLMRPLEEQAIFIAGELKNEVKHLHAEKEILQKENEALREGIKALPGPVEEIAGKLQQQQAIIATFEKEKQIWQNEKEELEVQQEQALKEQEARLKAESEEQMKQLAEAWKKELEQARRPWWKFW